MATPLLTYRRDQLDYVRSKKSLPCGGQLIGGVLFCGSAEGRENWIKRLSNCKIPHKFNHFVCFRDVQCDYALQFGFAEWASHPYVCR